MSPENATLTINTKRGREETREPDEILGGGSQKDFNWVLKGEQNH